MQEVVQALHLADERGDVVLLSRRPGVVAEAAAFLRVVDQPDHPAGEGSRVTLRHDHGVVAVASTSTSPSASVARIGLPIASASNTVSGVPSHNDGKTLRSNAETTRGMSRAKPANTKRSPSPSAWACCSSAGAAALRRRRKTWRAAVGRARAGRRRRGSCCPSSRASGSPSRPRSHPAPGPARRALRRPPRRPQSAELLERNAEIDNLHLVRLAAGAP